MTQTQTAPRCPFIGCKAPVTHTVQRLWTIPGRAPFALRYCCDQHIPGSKSTAPTPFYRVEKITDAA